jgi:putative phosphoribosyl transferase
MAHDQLQTTKELVLVPGATHLFEEPGALEMIAQLASNLLRRFLIDKLPTPMDDAE